MSNTRHLQPRYTEGYADALAAVIELLEELAQDAFIEEEVVVVVKRAIRLQLQPRKETDG